MYTPLLSALFSREQAYLDHAAAKIGRILRNPGAAMLQALGADPDGRATLLLAPPLPSDPGLHHRIDRELWFSFRLRLAAITTDPDALRGLPRRWTAQAGVMQPVDDDVKELIRFFGFQE